MLPSQRPANHRSFALSPAFWAAIATVLVVVAPLSPLGEVSARVKPGGAVGLVAVAALEIVAYLIALLLPPSGLRAGGLIGGAVFGAVFRAFGTLLAAVLVATSRHKPLLPTFELFWAQNVATVTATIILVLFLVYVVKGMRLRERADRAASRAAPPAETAGREQLVDALMGTGPPAVAEPARADPPTSYLPTVAEPPPVAPRPALPRPPAPPVAEPLGSTSVAPGPALAAREPPPPPVAEPPRTEPGALFSFERTAVVPTVPSPVAADLMPPPASVPAGGAAIRLPAADVLAQVPQELLTRPIEEIAAALPDGHLVLSLAQVLPQIAHGEVRLTAAQLAAALPGGALVGEVAALEAVAPRGIELPLAEVVAQVPPECFVAPAGQALESVAGPTLFDYEVDPRAEVAPLPRAGEARVAEPLPAAPAVAPAPLVELPEPPAAAPAPPEPAAPPPAVVAEPAPAPEPEAAPPALAPVSMAEMGQLLAEPEPVAAVEPAPEPAAPAPVAQAVPAPSGPTFRLAAAPILAQLPPQAFAAEVPQIASELPAGQLEFPVADVVTQLASGEVRVAVATIARQLPPAALAVSLADLRSAFPDGIELPLAQVVAHIPPEALVARPGQAPAPEVDLSTPLFGAAAEGPAPSAPAVAAPPEPEASAVEPPPAPTPVVAPPEPQVEPMPALEPVAPVQETLFTFERDWGEAPAPADEGGVAAAAAVDELQRALDAEFAPAAEPAAEPPSGELEAARAAALEEVRLALQEREAAGVPPLLPPEDVDVAPPLMPSLEAEPPPAIPEPVMPVMPPPEPVLRPQPVAAAAAPAVPLSATGIQALPGDVPAAVAAELEKVVGGKPGVWLVAGRTVVVAAPQAALAEDLEPLAALWDAAATVVHTGALGQLQELIVLGHTGCIGAELAGTPAAGLLLGAVAPGASSLGRLALALKKAAAGLASSEHARPVMAPAASPAPLAPADAALSAGQEAALQAAGAGPGTALAFAAPFGGVLLAKPPAAAPEAFASGVARLWERGTAVSQRWGFGELQRVLLTGTGGVVGCGFLAAVEDPGAVLAVTAAGPANVGLLAAQLSRAVEAARVAG